MARGRRRGWKGGTLSRQGKDRRRLFVCVCACVVRGRGGSLVVDSGGL